MTPAIYRLVMHAGPTAGSTYDLVDEVVTIGRDTANTIVINDAEVSRKHIRLTLQAGRYLIEDLNSMNGTFVNGKRLAGPHVLRPGEAILLGSNVTLIFEAAPSDASATVATAATTPEKSAAPAAETTAPPVLPPSPAPEVEPVRAQPVVKEPVPRSAPPPTFARPVPAKPALVEAEPIEAEPLEEEEEAPRTFDTRWVLAGCSVLIVVACLALTAFLFWVDAGGEARWCQFFSFIPWFTCPP